MVAEFKFAKSRQTRREIVARRSAQARVIWPPVRPEASDAQLGSAKASGRLPPRPPANRKLIADAPCRIASAIAAIPDRRYAIRMTPSHTGSALAIIEVGKRWNLTSASMTCCVITPAL